ncbi:MAG: competence/damage-inducible protein A [Gemmatimonadaceae bacterium]|jgi:nicotinamide-nucleotide amidase|nr:competence/damage-inducible protein A [Gemmatimonadaceae bacterium]
MDCELITIGDELLLGFTIDTNAVHIARTLAELGIRITRRATVGDTPSEIIDAVQAALARTGAVLTTGGLGPTADDRTHESLALAFGRELALHEAGRAALAERWQQRFGRSMPESNVRQFMLPAGAEILTNRHGSAPGIWLEDAHGRFVATMPGVPREMRGLLAEEIVPRLQARAAARGDVPTVVRSRTLRTTGISESACADRLDEFRRAVHDVPLSYLPGLDGVDLRLTLDGVSASEADARLDAAAATVRARVGDWIYGEGEADLAALVLELLRAHGHTIAVAESCTGGLLGGRLTAIPGSSAQVLGGIIAYDNRIKIEQLGVSGALLAEHGAVSEPVARAMATSVRARFGADVGVGITGIAGPSGGSEAKPVGTVWVAVDVAGAVHAVKPVLPGDRGEIRHRATQIALDRLRRVYARSADTPGWTVTAEPASR